MDADNFRISGRARGQSNRLACPNAQVSALESIEGVCRSLPLANSADLRD